jgi:hypothetical protein
MVCRKNKDTFSHGQGTRCAKIVLISSLAKKYPKYLKNVQLNLSAQAKSLGFFKKKLSLGVRKGQLISKANFLVFI